ncbi:patatin-like phospholipase family protein [Glutamicibacter sp. NPDC087344]|uniref:patatin-like phospholipase family protein n=1 Tax=Glutamicibacter sp. NPDC087344 TaxID=3363994 RepID=UPI0038079055
MNYFPYQTSRVSAASPYLDELPATAGARALVLDGGGSTGNAWLIGVLAGLAVEGVDVTAPQLTVGTSAGATAAAQLVGASAKELYEQILTTPVAPAPSGRNTGKTVDARVTDQLSRIKAISAASHGPQMMHQKMGKAALELPGARDTEFSARWKSVVRSRLTSTNWPQRLLYLTAVQAQTGALVVFENSGGLPLVDAVAASCSSGLPFWIGDRAYIDGGYRRNENADLAEGYAKVLVLSPLGGKSLHPADWGMELSAQIEQLSRSGSQVQVVVPTAAAEHYMGTNAMNQSLRAPAAIQGFLQGRERAGELREFWN